MRLKLGKAPNHPPTPSPLPPGTRVLKIQTYINKSPENGETETKKPKTENTRRASR